MPSEMLSGPDLGGGFLFQLSLDRTDIGSSFTFHAQEGGQDANGPPKGPPTSLDFLPTPSPCQFGGPRCWHRIFVIEPTEALRVRVAYNRMRFVMETMINQMYGEAPVPFEATWTELVSRIGPELSGQPASWSVDARTGAWVRGETSSPKSIRLRTTEPGVDRLSAIWSDFLIEPTGWTELPGGQTVYGAAAFLGTVRSGTRVRWFALPPSIPGEGASSPGTSPSGPRAVWRGISIDVEPSEPVPARHG